MTVGISNVTATWLDAGAAYNGFGLNVIDIGHGPDARLINLKVASASQFSVDPTGVVYANVYLGNNVAVYTVNANTSVVSDIVIANTVKTIPLTVNALPNAITTGAGTRAFVTDSSNISFLSIVTYGGSNTVPVFSDGSNWRVG